MKNKTGGRARMGDWMLLRYGVEVEANQWELPAEAQAGLMIETRNLPRRGLGGSGPQAQELAGEDR
ncbi:MAG: hypothetical protein RRB13_16140 [bacterium]|nr:hypothetical protein [bacterium]